MTKNKKTIEELTLLYTNIMILLQNCKINIILFYGTLLGFYRDNNFINMDDDIDVIISSDEYDILLTYLDSHLNKHPKIKIGIKTNDLLQLFYDNIGPFDIYIYNYDNDDILLPWDGNLLFNQKLILPIKQVFFCDFLVYVPNNIEEILFDIYGKNWKIPQTKNIDYNWSIITNVRFKK